MITDFASFVKAFNDKVVQPLVYLFVALGVAYFLWGVLKYLKSDGDDKERAEAKKMIFHGIIALFVMISVWGLVNVVSGSFELPTSLPAPVFH